MISADKNNPTLMVSLQQSTGLSRRRITDLIRDLRQYYPICTTKVPPGGYWFGDEQDIKLLTDQLFAEAQTLLKTANNLTRHLHQVGTNNGYK